MKLFKKDDLEDDEDKVLDLDEFDELEEEDSKKKDLSIEEYEKNFIFEIKGGCPICRGDVKGNDYYKYFCEKCNILFDKQDIMKKEFGKHENEGIKDDRKMHLKVVPLTEEQKAALDDKKRTMIERIQSVFSDDEDIKTTSQGGSSEPEPVQEPKIQEADYEEVRKDDAAEEDSDEEIVEVIEDEDTEEDPQEETDETEEDQEEPKEDSEDLGQETEDVEEDTTEKLKEEPEYELEDESKIIASRESSKIHKGTCHFIKKIHPENRIYFDTIEDGEKEGYELCVCLRRLIAEKKAEERDAIELEDAETDKDHEETDEDYEEIDEDNKSLEEEDSSAEEEAADVTDEDTEEENKDEKESDDDDSEDPEQEVELPEELNDEEDQTDDHEKEESEKRPNIDELVN